MDHVIMATKDEIQQVNIPHDRYEDLIRKETMLDAFINILITGAGYSKYANDLHHDDDKINLCLMAICPDRYEEKRAELMEIENDG